MAERAEVSTTPRDQLVLPNVAVVAPPHHPAPASPSASLDPWAMHCPTWPLSLPVWAFSEVQAGAPPGAGSHPLALTWDAL